MLVVKPRRFFLILSLIFVIPALTLAYLFLSDFSEFNMPYGIVRSFYLYTTILLLYTVLAVLIFRHYDRKHPLKNSSLWNYMRVVLGFLWLLDGILQIQPEMSFGFTPFILVPALQSLPAALHPLSQPLISLWTSSGAMMDALSAVLQIFLGLGFLLLRSRKFVSAFAVLSFLWAISIWVFGEDLGAPGIGMSILTGFPGAALFYAVASLILIFDFSQRTELRILKYSLAAMFMISAIIQAIPANGYWQAGSIASVTGQYAFIYEPRSLSVALYNIAVALSNKLVPWNLILTASLIAVGIAWIMRPRLASAASIALSALIWFIGQDFGIFGGYGTDPNTAFVLFLLSLSVFLTFRAKRNLEVLSSRDSSPTTA